MTSSVAALSVVWMPRSDQPRTKGGMNEHASIDGDDDSAGHGARLRKRLLDAGVSGSHDYEFVEYLLALTIPRVGTKLLAKQLLDDFGSIGPLLGGKRRQLAARRHQQRRDRRFEDCRGDGAQLARSADRGSPGPFKLDALGDYLHEQKAHRTEEVQILFLKPRTC
jgi:DNA repair protein RadC